MGEKLCQAGKRAGESEAIPFPVKGMKVVWGICEFRVRTFVDTFAEGSLDYSLYL